MVEVTSTKREIHWIKSCVYGAAGVGKTKLALTAPNPIIISAESGLLSLRKYDLPVIEVYNYDDLVEAYKFCKSDTQYTTVYLDSLSEIAETLVATFKPEEKDPRRAYGRMADIMTDMTKGFRNLQNKHVVMTAKEVLHKDDFTGKIVYIPYMPGQAFTQQVPYYFDLVLCMRVSGDGSRYLQTQPDITYHAKDRSGALDNAEKPDLMHIFNKILQGENDEPPPF